MNYLNIKSAQNIKVNQILAGMAEVFVDEAKFIQKQMPEARKILAPLIIPLQCKDTFTRIGAVDGSNATENLGLINRNLCIYSASGVAGNLKEITHKFNFCVMELIPKRQYHSLYPAIQRDVLELKTILKFVNSNEKTEIILGDGSVIGFYLWIARIQEHLLDMENISIVRDVFLKHFDNSNPSCLYNRVLKAIAKEKIVYIPKESSSQTFINKYLSTLFPKNIYTEIHDLQLLNHVLKNGEYIGPIPFKDLLSGNVRLQKSRLIDSIDVVFFKPHYRGSRVLKVQIHRNHRNSLEKILSTISAQYNVEVQVPYYLAKAHYRAKTLIPKMGDIQERIYRIAISQTESIKKKRIIHDTFELSRLLY